MPANPIFSPYSIAQGSSNYYACLFLANNLKPSVHNIFELHFELNKIPNQIKEQSVANSKLVWWLQDIERMYQRQASHPLLQQLTEFAIQRKLDKNLFINLISASQQDVEQTRHLDEISLTKYAKLGSGSLYTLLQQAIAAKPTQQPALDSYQLGYAIKLAQVIINFGQDAHKGRIYLPSNQLKEYQVAVKDILAAQLTERLIQLLRDRTEEVIGLLNQLLVENKKSIPAWQLFVNSSIRIQLKQLLEIRRNNFNILNQYIDITPLNKYLTALTSKFNLFFN